MLRRPPIVGDLQAETFDYFQRSLIEMGLDPGYARNVLCTRLVTLWHFAADKGIVGPCDTVRKKSGPKRLPLPNGGPGTLVALFRDRYLPEVLQPGNCTPQNYWRLLRDLKLCFGHDVKLSELSAQTLARYTTYLQNRALNPVTIRDLRNYILTLWRFAASEGLAPPLPAVRQIRVPSNVPVAWSQDEFCRIVAAARELPSHLRVGSLPAFKFWPAIILTCYYTALRRGTLFRLRHADLDIETAWLTVPGAMMKNRVGQKFHLGADCIAAVTAIWNPKRDRLFPVPLHRSSPTVVRTHFDKILAIAGVPKVPGEHCSHFHKIRRTAITLTAALAGVPQAIALAGHSGPAINARYIDPRFLPSHAATAWLPSPTANQLQPTPGGEI